MKTKGVTDQEKGALYLQVFERCEDWRRIYATAIGADRYNTLTEMAKQSNTSRWKVSDRIQRCKEEIERNLNALIQEEREKAVQEYIESLESESPQKVKKRAKTTQRDFLNRDEFLQFLNERANEIDATDDKTRNDILKMLSDNLRYKDADKEEQTEIQRFYTPITCQDCEIYKRCKGCTLGECPKA
jgi:predicted DNA-binding protein YlxM (UPF0122 family)